MQVPIPEPGEKGRVQEGFLYLSMNSSLQAPVDCEQW